LTAYSPTAWVNGMAPALSAANLNKLVTEIQSQLTAKSLTSALPTWVDGTTPALTDASPLNQMEAATALIASSLGLSYIPTQWQAGWIPGRNAVNLNRLEQAAVVARNTIDSGVVVPVPPAIANQNYNLVFEENWSTFDTTKWIRAEWAGNNTTPSTDAVVSGGTLKLSSLRSEGYPNHSVSTRLGAVGSPTTGEVFLEGYFECRSKYPAGKGSWPAFWLFSEHWVASNGQVPPYVAEIDIMEAGPGLGGLYLSAYNHVVHKNTSSPGGVADVFSPTGSAQFASPNIGDLTLGFHTYALLWTNTLLSFYCDDIFLASTVPYTPYSTYTGQPLFIILSQWVGKAGDWVGAYDATTPNTLTHEIDFVRVWQK
jgi:beta-glucanase (GH16 family)